MTRLWDFIVRWRTRLFNGICTFLVLIAPILGAPEVQAVIPPQYLGYVIAAVCVINYIMRPRLAATKNDPEVQVREELKRTEGPALIEVKAAGFTKAVIRG